MPQKLEDWRLPPARPLSLHERRAAASLFTISLHARQGTYVQVPLDQVESEVLHARGCAGADDCIGGRPAKASGENPADCQLRGADLFRPQTVRAVVEEGTLASARHLCSTIYHRLEMPEDEWEEVLHLPAAMAGQAIHEALAAVLPGTAADSPTQASNQGLEPGAAEPVVVMLRHLVDASFSWWVDEFLEDAAAKQQTASQPSRAMNKSQNSDIPLPVGERWHDARAAQAISDLFCWLRERGAPDASTMELWMSASATEALTGFKEAHGGNALAASTWDMDRILKVGGVSMAAGGLLVVTGCLAAPVIAGGIAATAGVIGGTSAAVAVSGVATAGVVTTALGGIGAGFGGTAMTRRTAQVSEFGFLPVCEQSLPDGRLLTVELKVDDLGQLPTWTWRHGDRPVTLVLHCTNQHNQASPDKRPQFTKEVEKTYRSFEGATRSACKRTVQFFSGGKQTKEEETAGLAAASAHLQPLVEEGAAGPKAGIELMRWKAWKGPEVQPVPHSSVDRERVVPEFTVCVAGWVSSSPGGYVQPFESMVSARRGWGPPEVHCLLWESKELIELNSALTVFLKRIASSQVTRLAIASLVSTTLAAALSAPTSALLALKVVVENEWTVAIERADKAGLILAQRLVAALPASRPVRLIAYSVGARLVFACLLELARCGHRGVVAEVVLLGAPVTLTPLKWHSARSVVAGRFINGFSPKDWLLTLLYRASDAFTGTPAPAGLKAVRTVCPDIAIEDVDLAEAGLVAGHADYPQELAPILAKLGI
mmetsp:Transcript_21996/g.61050  ORF Transcript_21996/g.61050 Transcript_21996/m.61050 type:complete len:771 (+) Transcript_21996:182-2494(+)|eukprot:CAMPEP_0117680186 /NCGR_PEP_ID=MMETSP0804-20121206/18210_1 /TAXON_ID=1074897 /ORGANISM="Tetraselmis astigmatica, Strain CCMP880" /LENGTH=770 /DNA_ID=CAMNT_0005489651 /DNA_START=97 /DNA_END=2409 /DNA_ORIENTATION=+